VDTVLVHGREQALLMAKSIVAGYYELTPAQFARAGVEWEGPPIDQPSRSMVSGRTSIITGIWWPAAGS
jgi:hypothetical protein